MVELDVTLGAASGALFATWWLLPDFGLEGSLRIGATLNVVCVAAVWPLAVRLSTSAARQSLDAPEVRLTAFEPVEMAGWRPAFWLWASTYGVAGFIALSLEIVWFRLLGVMVKFTAFTFGTLLTIHLAGIGLGAVVGSALARAHAGRASSTSGCRPRVLRSEWRREQPRSRCCSRPHGCQAPADCGRSFTAPRTTGSSSRKTIPDCP